MAWPTWPAPSGLPTAFKLAHSGQPPWLTTILLGAPARRGGHVAVGGCSTLAPCPAQAASPLTCSLQAKVVALRLVQQLPTKFSRTSPELAGLASRAALLENLESSPPAAWCMSTEKNPEPLGLSTTAGEVGLCGPGCVALLEGGLAGFWPPGACQHLQHPAGDLTTKARQSQASRNQQTAATSPDVGGYRFMLRPGSEPLPSALSNEAFSNCSWA